MSRVRRTGRHSSAPPTTGRGSISSSRTLRQPSGTSATVLTEPWVASRDDRRPAQAMTARGWAAVAAVSVLGGLPYLLIKIVVDDGMPPTFLAWSRVVIGAAVLIAFSCYAGTLPALR